MPAALEPNTMGLNPGPAVCLLARADLSVTVWGWRQHLPWRAVVGLREPQPLVRAQLPLTASLSPPRSPAGCAGYAQPRL